MTFAEFFPFYLRGLWMMIRQILPFLPFALMAAVPVARVLMRTIPRDDDEDDGSGTEISREQMENCTMDYRSYQRLAMPLFERSEEGCT